MHLKISKQKKKYFMNKIAEDCCQQKMSTRTNSEKLSHRTMERTILFSIVCCGRHKRATESNSIQV